MSGVGDSGLAAGVDASPDDVVALYDTWASQEYDADVGSWGYDAPERVAAMVSGHGIGPGEVLDAGCGTGRAGAALHAVGVKNIVGGDVSSDSIAVARARGAYSVLERLDLNAAFGYADDRFAAAVSVGVFTYLIDTEATIRQLLRVVAPGGPVIFTQRTDLWDDRDCSALVDSLVAEGVCTASVSDPAPYLPGHPEFGSDIGILYTTLVVQT